MPDNENVHARSYATVLWHVGGAKKAVFNDHYQVRRCRTAAGRRKALDLVGFLYLANSTLFELPSDRYIVDDLLKFERTAKVWPKEGSRCEIEIDFSGEYGSSCTFIHR